MLRSSTRGISYTSLCLKAVSYSKTLQLPQTSFGPKLPNAEENKSLINQSSQDLYKWQFKRPESEYSGKFVLHDGPPYANGDLHMGHALNKITKDIINRFELLYHNKKVLYQPGWDCHGLPIEMKAITSTENKDKLTAVEIRKLCRNLAQTMIDKQREQFTEFGIMTDFENPYITLNHEYEINQLKIFQKLTENGLLSRQQKPVWWGVETETALAEAELEYNNNHVSTAVYVKYQLKLEGTFLEKYDNIKLLIWTSTPWTLPANKAICVNENLKYTLLYKKRSNEHLLVAEDLAEDVLEKGNKKVEDEEDLWKLTKEGVSISGADLIGLSYSNPIVENKNVLFPILHGDHVTATAGTGLVHTAPAHGGDDYLIGKKSGLQIVSSVDDKGIYHGLGIPQEFKHLIGKRFDDSIWPIIDQFDEQGLIFHKNKKFKHSYPYDWRSNKPVIQRATPQWFINVEKIKDTAVKSLDDVKFFPESGKNRLLSFIKNRNEWCISRQRVWGVPLPIIYDKSTKEPVQVKELMTHIVNMIDKYGTDEWFVEEEDISRWLPEELQNRASELIKGTDTMDVWFDSGTSWSTLSSDVDESFASSTPLADIYLEGSDQHRGWFQSSLLNKIIASGSHGENFKPVAPFKEIITHGFTLDAKNNKMSKSKGNVISPKHAMIGGGKPFLPTLGTDGLRLWVASSNYTQDVNVTSEVLTRVFENLKKFRITLKYLLGNINGFKETVPYDQLNPLDKYILSKLSTLQETCIEYYKEHNFQRVVKDINHFISTDLSSSYFDISKDSLYTDSINSHKRRSIQTVLEILLRTQVGLLAPIQPILTQEVWNNFHQKKGSSPYTAGSWSSFYRLPENYRNPAIEAEFEQIWCIKSHLYKTLEQFRQEANIKSNLELSIDLNVKDENSKIYDILNRHEEWLGDYFLVSNASLGSDATQTTPVQINTTINIDGTEVVINVKPSSHEKCPRCWKYVAPKKDELCGRCDDVVTEQNRQ
ncbi:isoleucine--tRNA ligase, mitochondrial [[Candida] railenensis]|uniref:isoleucine--tRNA ligase n=1 Tax=[Candida] railenensis TaxID=45579 RepID=A0A9P0VZ79_9ASCO|nr:isoleucine--tRNA ligase, mitochondrial [[Candida] railenensis]